MWIHAVYCLPVGPDCHAEIQRIRMVKQADDKVPLTYELWHANKRKGEGGYVLFNIPRKAFLMYCHWACYAYTPHPQKMGLSFAHAYP